VLPGSYLTKEFQRRVITWFHQKGRVFYWRKNVLNLWQWLVLELLLKKTRAETVEKVFPKFIEKYSDPRIVVQADELELENDLRYLGLHKQRQMALRLVAEKILKDFGGQIPLNQSSLAEIPYVGLYISNAVLCFGGVQRRHIVDTNIARILARFHGLDIPKDAREKWIWDIAEKMVPQQNWREYNFGLLDIGALICKTQAPKCSLCSLKDMCSYTRESSQEYLSN